MSDPVLYFVGGEVEAFVDGSSAAIAWDTTAGYYDSNFSRGSVRLTSSSDFIRAPLTSAQSTFWASFQGYRGSNYDSGLNHGPHNGTWFTFNNASAVALYRVQGIGGTVIQPVVQFQQWNGSAWIGAGGGRIVATAARHKWDVSFVNAASSGDTKCYVDGNLLGEFTGNTAPVSPFTIADARIFSAGGAQGSNTVAISECRFQDQSTLGCRLATLGETANGANTDWTGSVSDINETGTYNDANFIQSGTANQVSTFVTTDLSATAQTYNVSGLVIAGRVLKGGTGPQNLYGVVRISTTNYVSAAVVTGPQGGLITDFAYNWAFFGPNPATLAAFTPTDVNALETGWKSAA